MAKTTHRQICAFFFWLKVLLSISICLAAIGYQAYIIYTMRSYALAHPYIAPPAPPVIQFPTNADANASACFYQGPLARLEPPSGVFMWGFDLQWNKEVPSQVVDRLGKRPPIFK